uniref:Uncharacterized protein n=1 Tax=Saimiri boliviensis boliviensis TaxID=39432 RepID=A0A2K6SP02_SAIBB
MDLMLLKTNTGVSGQKGRPKMVPGLPLHPPEGPSPRSGLTGIHCSSELRTPLNIHTWATTPVTPVLHLGSLASHHTLPCTCASAGAPLAD